jgi:hypothetical protein
MIPFLIPFLLSRQSSPIKPYVVRSGGGDKLRFANSLKVGDRVSVGTSDWLWRKGVHHWAKIEKIHAFESYGGSDWIRFYIRWENKRFGLIPRRRWIDYFDIEGVERA